MKKRYGFVSNSSSSSFTCKICDCTFEGCRGYSPEICEECIPKEGIDIHLDYDEIRKINAYAEYEDEYLELIVEKIKEDQK